MGNRNKKQTEQDILNQNYQQLQQQRQNMMNQQQLKYCKENDIYE